MLNAEGIEFAVWTGLSIGTRLSLPAAPMQSQRVGALVLLDTDAGLESAWKKLEYQVMKWGLKHLDPRVNPPALLPIMRGRTTLREHAELRSEYANNFPGMQLDSIRPGADAIIARDDLLSRLPQARVAPDGCPARGSGRHAHPPECVPMRLYADRNDQTKVAQFVATRDGWRDKLKD